MKGKRRKTDKQMRSLSLKGHVITYGACLLVIAEAFKCGLLLCLMDLYFLFMSFKQPTNVAFFKFASCAVAKVPKVTPILILSRIVDLIDE